MDIDARQVLRLIRLEEARRHRELERDERELRQLQRRLRYQNQALARYGLLAISASPAIEEITFTIRPPHPEATLPGFLW